MSQIIFLCLIELSSASNRQEMGTMKLQVQ